MVVEKNHVVLILEGIQEQELARHVTQHDSSLKVNHLTYHILKVIVFPQASLYSYSSSTFWTLGSTFPNAFFHTTAAESVKAFGYDMWIGEGIKTYGTLKVVVN